MITLASIDSVAAGRHALRASVPVTQTTRKCRCCHQRAARNAGEKTATNSTDYLASGTLAEAFIWNIRIELMSLAPSCAKASAGVQIMNT